MLTQRKFRIALFTLMIYIDEQNEFRKTCSCEELIFTLAIILQLYLAYFDVEKAFDKICRVGVSGLLYNAILTIYESSNSYVQINDMFSIPLLLLPV